jgi:hypothetical protein
LEESSNRVTLTLVTEKSHMSRFQRPRLLHLILTLWLSTVICTPSLAEDITLLSIGPRFGFSGKTPLLGEQQKYYFDLIDVAAVFKLPWSMPAGESPWRLETRLITSAGVLQGAGENGLMVTLVPDLALNGWGGLSPSTPERGQDSSATTSSACKTSGVLFKSSRPWGFASIHFLRPMPDFVPSTSPMPACTDRTVSAWTCTSWKLDTNFDTGGNEFASSHALGKRATALWLPP